MLKRILITIILVLLTAIPVAGTVMAQETAPGTATVTQEDPAAAKVAFSGLSLLIYYSASLDPIIARDPAAAQTTLEKMPFASVPEEMDEPTALFASAGTSLGQSIYDLLDLWDRQNELLRQYRLKDAQALGAQIKQLLPEARQQLANLRDSVRDTGDYFKIDSAKPESELKKVYIEVQAKLDRLEAMLEQAAKPLLDLDRLKEILTPEQIEDLLNSGDPDILHPTDLNLEINPLTAFVGDSVSFSGSLTSLGKPLAEREVDLLLENARHLTVRTDSSGFFSGSFRIPYWYQSSLAAQAIYYPQNEDIGLYLGSSSPAVNLTVLFYPASLTLQAENPAYPGREVKVNGTLDYGDAPALERENARLYLDDTEVESFTAATSFTLTLALPANISTGSHALLVSIPANGRYAPVSASAVLEVTLAETVLNLNLPGTGWIPGSLGLDGALSSDLGPLQNASIQVVTNNQSAALTADSAGSFSGRLSLGFGLSLLGSQDVSVRVQPAEPWNAPLEVTRHVFVINYVVCGLLLLLILALSVYLPRRMRRWSASGARMPVKAVLPPAVEPVYQNTPVPEPNKSNEQTPDSVFSLYRLALKLMQALTRSVMKPQQTFREYVNENSDKLGPLGRYYLEFTRLIERLIYARRLPGPADLDRARELSQSIHKESGRENL